MVDKQVTVKVATDVELAEVEALENKLDSLHSEAVGVDVDVDDGDLKGTEAEIEDLDDTTIDIDVNNIKAMEATEQIGQGFDRLKQGASEIGQKMGDILESSGRMEQTEAFLSMNMGADKAKQKLGEIRSVTDSLPGDDVTLQNLLSQAAMKDASMTTDAFNQMGSAAADYMAAMQNFGKTSTETQQDLMNYILAGNTAEIERSPILQSHIDKLKEGTTVQERAKLLQEALNEEGWAGIASQDIYNNKFQQFNDMLERGKMNLGGVFQEGAKGAMDFALQLDQASGGLVGMGFALVDFASPITDSVMGLGQMATGIKALKDLELVKMLKESAAAQWLLNIAQSMSPIHIIILAVIALIAVLAYLYFNNEQVRESINWLGQSIVQVGQIIYTTFINAVNWVIGALQNLWNYIMTLGGLLPEQASITGNQIIDTIIMFLAFFATLPLQVGMIIVNTIAKAAGFGDNFSQKIIRGAVNAVTGFASYITRLPGIVLGEFQRVLGLVNDFINHLPEKVWEMGTAIIDALKHSLGIGSPGHMYYMFEGELERLKNLPEDMKLGITGNVSDLGKGMVNSFNPELESTGGQPAQNGGVINITINGDVDNEKRIQEIVDAVTRALAWDNKTAGRIV